jgi:hypothetical protein
MRKSLASICRTLCIVVLFLLGDQAWSHPASEKITINLKSPEGGALENASIKLVSASGGKELSFKHAGGGVFVVTLYESEITQSFFVVVEASGYEPYRTSYYQGKGMDFTYTLIPRKTLNVPNQKANASSLATSEANASVKVVDEGEANRYDDMKQNIGKTVEVLLKTGVKVFGRVNNVVKLADNIHGAYEFATGNATYFKDENLKDIRCISLSGADMLWEVITDPRGGAFTLFRELLRLESTAWDQQMLRTQTAFEYYYKPIFSKTLKGSTTIDNKKYAFVVVIELYQNSGGLEDYVVKLKGFTVSPELVSVKWNGKIHAEVDVSVGAIGRIGTFTDEWKQMSNAEKEYCIALKAGKILKENVDRLIISIFLKDVGFAETVRNSKQIAFCDLSENPIQENTNTLFVPMNEKSDNVSVEKFTVVLSTKSTMDEAQKDAKNVVSLGVPREQLSVEVFGSQKFQLCANIFSIASEAERSKTELARSIKRVDLAVISIQQERFIEYYQKIVSVINSGNLKSLNNEYHPKYGLFVLNNPGVEINVDRIFNIEKYFAGLPDNRSTPNSIPTESPRMETLPSYRCMDMHWSKEGVFASAQNNFVEILRSLQYRLDLDGALESQRIAKKLINVPMRQVIQTEGLSMSFAVIDGRWYWIVLDLVTPCST